MMHAGTIPFNSRFMDGSQSICLREKLKTLELIFFERKWYLLIVVHLKGIKKTLAHASESKMRENGVDLYY